MEFGSDFHRCEADFIDAIAASQQISLMDLYPESRLYASGRHAIESVIRQEGWKRIWIPAYFCYEVIDAIAETGIKIMLYDDSPTNQYDDDTVHSLSFQDGDVLLRMNYFGIRSKRDNENIPVPIIEDHSHDLCSDWSLNSNADWCVASIRKILPIAAGGILWSPKKLVLPNSIRLTDECKAMAELRYEAMQMKRDYLRGAAVCKDDFRVKYIQSEEQIGVLELSAIDEVSNNIVRNMNIRMWSHLKAENWHLAYSLLKNRFEILHPENKDYWRDSFSLIIVCDNMEERNALRKYLISNSIYPAVLWSIPEYSNFKEAADFSHRMLSVHCDARYSKKQIKQMCEIILQFKND